MSAPPARIHASRIVHTIHATTDIRACRLLYQDALGGLVFAENYFPAEDRDAVLLYVANHMVEPMAPRNADDMTKPYARLTKKIGQSFHSFELKVQNGAAASQAFRDAGCTLASDYGVFFYVKGQSTGGILLEACETPMPNDPYDRTGWNAASGVGHACSVVRLDHIACVTAELDKALRVFTEVIDGEILSDEEISMPEPARRVMLQVADTRIALIRPQDPGTGMLGAFLKKPQNGIYALVWQIVDVEQATAHFEKLGLRLTRTGCITPGFAIEPSDFFGARHEFVCVQN